MATQSSLISPHVQLKKVAVRPRFPAVLFTALHPPKIDSFVCRATNKPQKLAIFVQPGTTIMLEISSPIDEKVEKESTPSVDTTTASPPLPLKSDGKGKTKTESTFLIARYMLAFVQLLERCFGKEFLVSVLTDGISNPINEINLFGFLENVAAAPCIAQYPRAAKGVILSIPVFNMAAKALFLFWVQRLHIKAVVAAAMNVKATAAADDKEAN